MATIQEKRGGLQEHAAFLLLADRDERSAGGILEDFPNAFACTSRALEIVSCADLLGDCLALLGSDRALGRPTEVVEGLGVPPEILLASDEDNRQAGAKVHHFRDPLFLDVFQRVGTIDGEADEDNVRVRIGERAETVIVFLSGRIPESELDAFAVDFDVGDVVFEYGRDIDLWECSLGEDDQETGLSASAITDDHKFPSDFRHGAVCSGVD